VPGSTDREEEASGYEAAGEAARLMTLVKLLVSLGLSRVPG